MIFEWMNDPTAWAGLATLIVLEIVLGIDNLVFIAILADKLPAGQRDRARRIGLLLALVMRLVLLASISWIVTLTEPIFSLFGSDISWRDVILLIGGTFLLFKGTMELHERLEGAHGATTGKLRDAVFWQVIVQIVVLDAVFSLDSVITAVGMVSHLSVMVIAVIVSVGVMLLASRPLMAFVGRHPTVVILCLGFLLMIGVSLIAEGLGFHVPKGYLYAAIGFSVLIEAANQTVRRNIRKRVQTMDLRARTSEAILRILRGGAKSTEASQEMAAIVSAEGDEPVFSSEESGMIERVLTLGERPVRSIMIPRRDVVWLDAEDLSDVVLDEIKASGRSRFLVCRGEIDEVLGVVHAKDLLEQQRYPGALDIAKAARPPLFVTERMPAIKLLETFGESSMHMAVVIDEHGAVEGLVTPMDILIAIAGDLPERAEDAVPYAQQVGTELAFRRRYADRRPRAHARYRGDHAHGRLHHARRLRPAGAEAPAAAGRLLCQVRLGIHRRGYGRQTDRPGSGAPSRNGSDEAGTRNGNAVSGGRAERAGRRGLLRRRGRRRHAREGQRTGRCRRSQYRGLYPGRTGTDPCRIRAEDRRLAEIRKGVAVMASLLRACEKSLAADQSKPGVKSAGQGVAPCPREQLGFAGYHPEDCARAGLAYLSLGDAGVFRTIPTEQRNMTMTYAYKVIASPVGSLKLVASDKGLAAILWENDDPLRVRLGPLTENPQHPILLETERQLGKYFAGELRQFTVPLDFPGHRIPEKGLGGAADNSVRRDEELWRDRASARAADRPLGRGRGERRESGLHHHTVPSRHRIDRQADQVRRRAQDEGASARARIPPEPRGRAAWPCRTDQSSPLPAFTR